MFRLSSEEWVSMRSHFVTALPNKRNVSAIPFAFTEQGVSMLSGILNVYDAINFLLQKDNKETEQKQRKRIGF